MNTYTGYLIITVWSILLTLEGLWLIKNIYNGVIDWNMAYYEELEKQEKQWEIDLSKTPDVSLYIMEALKKHDWENARLEAAELVEKHVEGLDVEDWKIQIKGMLWSWTQTLTDEDYKELLNNLDTEKLQNMLEEMSVE